MSIPSVVSKRAYHGIFEAFLRASYVTNGKYLSRLRAENSYGVLKPILSRREADFLKSCKEKRRDFAAS